MPRPLEHPEHVEYLQLAAATTAAVLVTTADAVAAEDFARAIHVLRISTKPFVFLRADLISDSDPATMVCREALDAAADGTLFIPDLQRSSRQTQEALLDQLPRCRGQIVSAATPDLFLAVQEDRFSSRLFYRLNILHFDLDEADSAHAASGVDGGAEHPGCFGNS